MINRSKWQSATSQDAIKIGILVILKEDNLPPMSWKLGRIVDLYPGEDKIFSSCGISTHEYGNLQTQPDTIMSSAYFNNDV